MEGTLSKVIPTSPGERKLGEADLLEIVLISAGQSSGLGGSLGAILEVL